MTSPQWLQTIAKIAPTIAAAASGPFGGIVGPLVSKALGLVVHTDDPSQPALNPIDALQQAVTNGTLTPEQIIALRQADMDFQKYLSDNKLKIEQLVVEDVQSARGREIAVRDTTPRNLAYAMIGGFFTVVAALLVGLTVFPERTALFTGATWALIGALINQLYNEARSATSYYFGTTAGNEDSTSNTVVSQLSKATKGG